MILFVLIALAARVDAAPGEASIALAVRYANVLTGVDDADDRDQADDASDASDASDADQASDAGDAGDASDLDVASGAADRTGGGDPAGGDADQLAMLDAEQAPAGAAPQGDASLTASPAGAAEGYERWLRRLPSSRWGRLDLGLIGRRLWSEPMHAPPHRSLELWLVATWRR